MISLPIVFLCNTLLFAVILEERFKVLTTLSVSAVALILSVVSSFVVGGIFADPALSGLISDIVSVFWVLLASVFIASNNILQKIYLALLLITNYVFAADFTPMMMGALPFGGSGIMAVLLGNGVYILFSLVIMALYIKPMHYFYRRGVSPSIVILCLMQAGCWYVAQGGLTAVLGVDSFALRFFTVLALYIFIIFNFRSVYGGAKYKEKDVLLASDDAVADLQAEYFNAMLVNVESYKNTKKNISYIFNKIGLLAQAGKTREIADYVAVSEANNRVSPLLAGYCEDKFVNAVMATKAAQAEGKGIRVESNLALGELRLQPIEICTIVNELMSFMIGESADASEDKYIRLNIVTGRDQLTLEAVHSSAPAPAQAWRKKTAFDFIKGFFEEDGEENNDLRNIKRIVARHSGKLSVSRGAGETITRIGINY